MGLSPIPAFPSHPENTKKNEKSSEGEISIKIDRLGLRTR
jgi:hypothetical protein